MYPRYPSRLLSHAFALSIVGLAAPLAGEQLEDPPKAPTVVRLDAGISESSGLVASRHFAPVLWTHGDSGNPPELFAIGRDGQTRATFRVAADNRDWEDITLLPADGAGPDRLLIADIGNNARQRTEVQVIIVDEPDPAKAGGEPVVPQRVLRLRYPPGIAPFDAEACFVVDGVGYVAEKAIGRRSRLFRFDLEPPADAQVLEPAGVLPVWFPVTGADASSDGRTLAVATVAGLYLIELRAGLPLTGEEPTSFYRRLDPVMEAVALVGDDVLATSEAGVLVAVPRQRFGD